MKDFDIIVIGAGHAGCEAALAASGMGMKTLLVTMSLGAAARMSCNPAVGGLAKGQIVREVDALGGMMGRITDLAGIQFRMLNKSRGPAVWSPRAQCDKGLYSKYMRLALDKRENLSLLEDEVSALKIKNGAVAGIETKSGAKFGAKAVVVTTGTFLKGLMHVGLRNFSGGRIDEPSAEGLSGSLREAGLLLKRLKTGTPPRVHRDSVDYSRTERQPGDNPPVPFSHFTDTAAWAKEKNQLDCWLTYTNERTHEAIRRNLDRSPLYAGVIKSTGPRYCPSIEDKVVRFSARERHQVFLEPEGYDVPEIYVNGISTSLPEDVQDKIVHSIRGLEKAKILRYGYAIEYDFCPPTQLAPSLETKAAAGLFLAGQINGTTGYEEAAGQGIAAGINAALRIKGEEPFVMERGQSYIGVLIDDLVTKGVDEPYRMFTSRAEYRLILRSDNADIRLIEHGRRFGLVPDKLYKRFLAYKDTVDKLVAGKKTDYPQDDELNPWSREKIDFEAWVEMKYSGYIERQKMTATKMRKYGDRRIPAGFDYDSIPSLPTEAKQKLKKITPGTIGQASRVPGVTPSDVAVLMVYLEKRKQ